MADLIRLAPQPLTPEGFAPFGRIIRHERQTKQQPVDGVFEHDGSPGAPALTLIRVDEPLSWPVPVPKLERHPHSAQGFLPLAKGECLVLACPSHPDGSPDLSGLQAFLTGADDGVLYHRNVWHKGITPLAAGAEFAMLMVKSASGVDTIFAELDPPVDVLRP